MFQNCIQKANLPISAFKYSLPNLHKSSPPRSYAEFKIHSWIKLYFHSVQ